MAAISGSPHHSRFPSDVIFFLACVFFLEYFICVISLGIVVSALVGLENPFFFFPSKVYFI